MNRASFLKRLLLGGLIGTTTSIVKANSVTQAIPKIVLPKEFDTKHIQVEWNGYLCYFRLTTHILIPCQEKGGGFDMNTFGEYCKVIGKFSKGNRCLLVEGHLLTVKEAPDKADQEVEMMFLNLETVFDKNATEDSVPFKIQL
jgi:hypothetical protein